MIDIFVITIAAILTGLVGVTSYAATQYYKQLRRAQAEYEKARDTVEDIVLSFNRELQREAEKISSVGYKAEGATVKADSSLRKIETIEQRIAPVETQLSQISTQVSELGSSISSVVEINAKTVEKISNLDTAKIDAKVSELQSEQESLKTKLTGIEEQIQKLSTAPELTSEQPNSVPVPVLPIKRDKALAALTETEVAVLEFLSSEGPKTAPEIKEKVQLSREHTARLMKKLYEEGYLERETGKLPFKYSVKKEMEKLLKKTETPPSA